MLFQITHEHTLLNDFYGIETNLDKNELEKVLFYVEYIHMRYMPNLEYIFDDTLSEKDIIELLPLLYKDTGYTFKPIYKKPEQKFITIDLLDIENSFNKFKPYLSEINDKYALPNTSLSLMRFYQIEVNTVLKELYATTTEPFETVDQCAQNYNHQADLLKIILDGGEVLPEWELRSLLGKDLTGMKFIETQDKEILL